MADDEHKIPLLGNDDEIEHQQPLRRKSRHPLLSSLSFGTLTLFLLLLTSLYFNHLTYSQIRELNAKTNGGVCTSRYANLVQDYPDTMQYATIYGEGAASEEAKAAVWDEIDISEGIIAVPHTWADSHGVPRSQPFPWDSSKDIYVVGGYHNMHCLKLLQAYSADAHAGRKSLVPYHHVSHCLDVLRQNVLCEADDVLLAQKPRALGGLDKRPGDGQARQCKDWNKLSLFAQEHNACYKRLNITKGAIDTGVKSEFERYAFCPEGSPYAEKVAKFFEEFGHRVTEHVDEWAEKPGEGEGHHGKEKGGY